MKRLFSALILTIAAVPALPAQRTFLPEDSMRMRRITGMEEGFFVRPVAFSPDRNRFIVTTRRAVLEKGENEQDILLYDAADVRRYVNGNGLRPEGKAIATFSAASNSNPIELIRWLDGNTLSFVARDGGDTPAQVYTLDIGSGALNKWTGSASDVQIYSVSPKAGTVVYAADVEYRNPEADLTGFIVGVRTHWDLARIDVPARTGHYRYFVERAGSAPRAVSEVIEDLLHADNALWLSPDGTQAIALLHPRQPGEQWTQYAPIADHVSSETQSKWQNEYSAPKTNAFGMVYQFYLIDIASGTMRPAMESPALHTQFGSHAAWLPDGKSVILVGGYLPAGGVDEKTKKRRLKESTIVEYMPQTGQYTVIYSGNVENNTSGASPFPPGEGPPPPGRTFKGLAVAADGSLVTDWLIEGKTPVRTVYRKENGRWRSRNGAPDAGQPLTISIRQALDVPPDFLARDESTGREELLTELNPQFQELTFGRAALFEWQDASGKKWSGGIVYPPGYREGERYPLLIQTYEFSASKFLIDGPPLAQATVFQAQAYANRGIVVIQAQYPYSRWREQLEDNRIEFEGLIDALDAKGVIDRSRVGIAGFSNSCAVSQHFFTFSRYPVAAAVLVDGYMVGHWGYASMFGGIGSPYIEHMLDARPFGNELGTYVGRSPSFNLERVNTAVRYEYYQPGSPVEWDVYATMRRMNKPVEMAFFPKGDHNTWRTPERLKAQHESLDWFSFWLTGYEDPRKDKEEQYKRWRQMRQLRDAAQVKE